MDQGIVAAVATAAAGVAVAYLVSQIRKHRRPMEFLSPQSPGSLQPPGLLQPPNSLQPPGFSLIGELVESDALFDVVRLMPAAATARMSRANRAVHARLSDPSVAAWCAESRKKLLLQRAVPGDLPLAFTSDITWTLERLYLCEHPPRFPQVLFRFACDEVEDGTGPSSEIAKVAALLRRHPKLRIRIHGYAQPEAPPSIGEALAQARATSVRQVLLQKLADLPEFMEEDPEEGVRPDRERSPWSMGLSMSSTRCVGNKVQAVGRWGYLPSNLNYARAMAAEELDDEEAMLNELLAGGAEDEEEAEMEVTEVTVLNTEGEVDENDDDNDDDEEEEDDDDDEQEFGGPNRLRRAEFTLLGLD